MQAWFDTPWKTIVTSKLFNQLKRKPKPRLKKHAPGQGGTPIRRKSHGKCSFYMRRCFGGRTLSFCTLHVFVKIIIRCTNLYLCSFTNLLIFGPLVRSHSMWMRCGLLINLILLQLFWLLNKLTSLGFLGLYIISGIKNYFWIILYILWWLEWGTWFQNSNP